MSTVAMTIFLAFVVVMIAMAALATSWLLTGKSSLRPGACGRDPTKKQDDKSCGTKSSCSLCEHPSDTSANKTKDAKDKTKDAKDKTKDVEG